VFYGVPIQLAGIGRLYGGAMSWGPMRGRWQTGLRECGGATCPNAAQIIGEANRGVHARLHTSVPDARRPPRRSRGDSGYPPGSGRRGAGLSQWYRVAARLLHRQQDVVFLDRVGLQDAQKAAERLFDSRQCLSVAGRVGGSHPPPQVAGVGPHGPVLVDQLRHSPAGSRGALPRQQLGEDVLFLEGEMPDDVLREERLHGRESVVRLRLVEQVGGLLDVRDVLGEEAMVLDGLLKRLDLRQRSAGRSRRDSRAFCHRYLDAVVRPDCLAYTTPQNAGQVRTMVGEVAKDAGRGESRGLLLTSELTACV
jgi:hypothetical protein